MGIFCEIQLAKTGRNEYKPGEIVSGTIKYALDKETTLTSATVSIKGLGHVSAKKKDKDNTTSTYENRESYIHIDQKVLEKDSEVKLPVGAYEADFNFALPENLPGSFHYENYVEQYHVSCKIEYYIRIKFEKSGFLSLNKKFKKIIIVAPAPMVPVLPTEPCMLGARRELVKLWPKKPNIINLKAVIDNSVLSPGDTAKIKYELSNDSNVTIKYVKTKLVETFKVTLGERFTIIKDREIMLTDSKSAPISRGVCREEEREITIPEDLASFANSKIVSRDYFIVVKIQMPVPYRNLLLRIPVQVGLANNTAAVLEPSVKDPPPSYWEVMLEDTENDKGKND